MLAIGMNMEDLLQQLTRSAMPGKLVVEDKGHWVDC